MVGPAVTGCQDSTDLATIVLSAVFSIAFAIGVSLWLRIFVSACRGIC